MNNFPLYTTLSTNLPKKDLTVSQKNELIQSIGNMNSEVHELLYALIKSYFFEHDNNASLILPYNGQLSKERIDFDLSDFPIGLRQLLYKFIMVHTKKLDEDKIIQEIHNV